MGLLDFLFDKEKAKAREIEKLKKKLTNPWVQSPERNYAAEQLLDIGTDEAIRASLERFKMNVQNATYDSEEKMYLFNMLVGMGPTIVDVVKDAVRKEPQQVNWLMRILDDMIKREDLVAFICELLEGMDIDYERDPEKKEQLLLRAKGFMDHQDLQQQVARFIVDDSEAIRFVAASQVVEHKEDWAQEALRDNLALEDSGRVLNLVCEAFIANEWLAWDTSSDDTQALERIRMRLPKEYSLNDEGFIEK